MEGWEVTSYQLPDQFASAASSPAPREETAYSATRIADDGRRYFDSVTQLRIRLGLA